jgi:cobalamin biosynthetic protein CobC
MTAGITVRWPAHGGDLAGAEARWGRPAEGWLDLSTGINPWPYPLPDIAGEAWTRLPAAADDAELRRAAARRYRAPGPETVLPIAGSGAAIQLLPRLRPPGRVAVLGPTYPEHAASWRAAGHQVAEVPSPERVEDVDVAVVVNPNNPDGRLLPQPQLLALAEQLAARGGLLVVDEAFADSVRGGSILPALPPATVVLRSFGKFYGLAGLRLGFAIGRPEVLAPLAQALGPWSVSGPALAIGCGALADDPWADTTQARLAEASARLERILSGRGLAVAGGTPLFRLAECDDAHRLWHRLGTAGILTRAFRDRPRLLRFGLPAADADWDRLERAL